MAQFGLSAEDALFISKKYTEDTIIGEGAIKGNPGKDGADGKDGKDGKSAYQAALDNGFIGTDVEWLESLKGDKGDKGEPGVPGQDGAPGDDGKSAYDLWLEAGNVGSEQDFLDSLKGADGTMSFDDLTEEQKESLKGADGKSAYQIWLDEGNTGTEEEFLESLKGDGADVEFDDVPTENSNNAVKSGGIFEALDNKQDNIIILEGYKTQEEDGFGNYIINPAPNCTYKELLEMLEQKKRVVLRIYSGTSWIELYPVRNGNSTATYFVSPVWNTEKKIQELNVAFYGSTVGWKIGVKPLVGVPTGGTQGQVLTKISDEDCEVEWSGSSPEPFIIKSSYTDTSEGFVVDTSNTVPVMWSDWYEHYLTGRQIIWELHKNTIDSGDDVIKMYINSIGIYDKNLNVLEAQFTGVGTPTRYNTLNTNLSKFLYVAWFRSGSNAATNYKKVKRFLINEIPTGGTTGQILAKKSDTDYDAQWIDLPSGEGTLVVTGEYSEDDNGEWTVSNVNKTFTEIDTALDNGQNVILKIYPEGTTENPYLLYPAMHYKGMGVAFSMMVTDTDQISGLSVMIMTDGSIMASRNAYEFGKFTRIKTIEIPIDRIHKDYTGDTSTKVGLTKVNDYMKRLSFYIEETFFTENNIDTSNLLNIYLQASGKQGGALMTTNPYGTSDIFSPGRSGIAGTGGVRYIPFNLNVFGLNGNSGDSSTEFTVTSCKIRYEE